MAYEAQGAHRKVAPFVDGPHSTRYVWYVVFLLFVVNVFNYMDRMALSVLAPSIKADLSLSDAQLGLLTGFAFALFYAAFGIPIGRWADHGNRRNIISLALATWSVMTALCGAAQNFWHLFLARVGVGAGEAGCLPSAQSMLCDYVPLERRSGVFAIHTFGLFSGMMVGMAAAGWLGEAIGWRWTFVILGLPGVALALIVRLTLREPARGKFDSARDTGAKSSFGETLRTLWRCRTYRFLVLHAIVANFVQASFGQWWPSFYVRVHGLDLPSVGASLGAAIALGAGAGLLIGGFAANKFAKRDVRLPLIICAGTISLALPTVLTSLFVSSASVSIILVALTSLLWNLSGGPVLATIYGVTPPHMRGTAGAVTIFMISILGLGLGPFCVGWLSDTLTQSLGEEALRYAFLIPVALHPLMILFLYLSTRGLARDLDLQSTDAGRLHASAAKA